MKKLFKLKKNKFILVVFLLFQLVVGLNFSVFSKILPATGKFSFADASQWPVWLWNRANFDGVHYVSIAQNSYGLYQQAFFPLYPKIIRLGGWVLKSQYLLTGVLVSLVSFFLALKLFWRLLALDYSEKLIKKTLLFLLIFPTSFYFAAVYTESLFFFLIIASFYLARQKKWFWAPVVAGFSAATRLVGVFMIPALLIELWRQTKSRKLTIGQLLLLVWVILAASSGLLLYMRFLGQNYCDPLLFAHVQPHFGAQRSGGEIILLYQVLWRYTKMILTVQPANLIYFNVWFELLAALLFLGLLILAYFQKVRESYLAFSVFSYLAPTLSGTFSSMPRYVLLLFPGFIVLAQLSESRPWLIRTYLFLSVVLFFFCQWLFSRGYWVA